MRSRQLLVTLIAAVTVATTACSNSGGDGPGAGDLVDGKTFTMTMGTDPGALDPAMTVLTGARIVGRFLYSRLVEVQDDGTVVASLAEKWDADDTVATFTLRKGVTCGDGEPVTASVVADNLNFIADPAHRSPLLGTQVQAGTVAVADDAARRVTVTSGAPDAFLLRDLGSVPMICRAGLDDRSLPAEGKASTGMFELVEAVPNDHYTLARRADFTWGPGDWASNQKGLPDEVVIRIVPNETTAANMLVSDDVNAALIVGPEQDRLDELGLFHADMQVPVGQFHFNQAAGRPTADESVRRALMQALDLAELRTVVGGRKAVAPTSLITLEPAPCDVGGVTGNLPERDVAAAKAALDATGWEEGPGGVRTKNGEKLSLTLVYLTGLGDSMSAAAELVQERWKAIGVDAALKGLDNQGIGEVLFGTGDWDVSAGQITAPVPSQLVPFFAGPPPPTGTNFGHVDNAEYAAFVAKAAGKPGAAGCEDWASAEAALLKAVDVVPYANSVAVTYGRGSRFSVDVGIVPTSIRMYE